MEENLLHKLKKTDHLIVQMMFKNSENKIPNRPPSRTQAQILDILIKTNKVVTQKEIEEKLNVSRATISETLTKMEKYEMIKREIGEDTRTKVIKLTNKSIEMHKKMDQMMKCISNKVENILDSKEKEKLNELLDKLITGLEIENKGGTNV